MVHGLETNPGVNEALKALSADILIPQLSALKVCFLNAWRDLNILLLAAHAGRIESLSHHASLEMFLYAMAQRSNKSQDLQMMVRLLS